MRLEFENVGGSKTIRSNEPCAASSHARQSASIRELVRRESPLTFQLTSQEFQHLRSQFVISSWGGRRYPPFAFTEHGVAMLSSVLRSPRAVQVNIAIMRAFVRLRRLLASHADLAQKLAELEKKYAAQFRGVFDAIRALMTPPARQRRPIGFRVEEARPRYRRQRPSRRGRPR